MGLIRLSGIVNAKKKLLRSLSDLNQASSKGLDVPRGYFAVYVGESQKKRFVVPIYLLNEPCFQELLREAEEEFGYEHPMGGITISCGEDFFSDLICRLTD
ncbi:hypothetical protein TIFTF001_042224 [Ficus carica]|uniref:Small auxin up regulated protein n=1 Tax=Ficus carica TaxID=3494 RepID=A0AA88A106_FICCA|nr:hypothetical protein TIFTF001_042222 [Ficus carica]GMN35439.1 hypothetical protein TIFTF001_042224 [Ficus carica]